MPSLLSTTNVLSPTPDPLLSRGVRNSRLVRRAGRTIRIGALDKKILEIVTRARFIDAGQIIALLDGYRPNTIQSRLTLLFDAFYLSRPERQQELTTRPGTSAIVYGLGSRGAALAGVSPKDNNVSLAFLAHTLLVSRTYATTAAACRHVGVELESWENEAPLPTVEISVYKDKGEEVKHVADAFCIVRLPGGFDHLFLEIDRGTEPGERGVKSDPDPRQTSLWKTILYYQELYRRAETLIGIKKFRVLLLVPSIGRIESLLELCRRADGDRNGLGIFWMTTHDQITWESPQRLLEPVWFKPSNGPHTLWTPEQLSKGSLYRVALPEGLPDTAAVLT